MKKHYFFNFLYRFSYIFFYIFLLFVAIIFLPKNKIFAQPKKEKEKQIMTIKEKSLVTDGSIEMSVIGHKDDLKTVTNPTYTQLYVRSTEGLFLGNGCSEEFQRLYGMEYVVVPPKVKKNKRVSGVSPAKYFWHNLGANFKLFWRNGFFWKSRMLRKIKACSVKIGDIEE